MKWRVGGDVNVRGHCRHKATPKMYGGMWNDEIIVPFQGIGANMKQNVPSLLTGRLLCFLVAAALSFGGGIADG